MELRLVYRALGKISDWTLQHFYSEVLVDTSHLDSIDADSPLILVASHHNEIIDIAALAVTVPNRRFVSYWAKSSMFQNPLARLILDSAAAIPVQRNHNNRPGGSSNSDNHVNNNASLFSYTSFALASGNAVGVFPEGTSYTQPKIMQVKEGAAWAAVEYVEWSKNKGVHTKPLMILPVGIVYTNKACYRSKVIVKYGKPIHMDRYQEELAVSADQTKKVVKDITEEIERRLTELTINAPDWETFHAARLGFEMKYEDSSLSQYLPRMNQLVDEFSTPTATRFRLLRYYSLLHYTDLDHSQLSSLLGEGLHRPSPMIAFRTLMRVWLTTLLHPRFAFYLPALATFLPAFVIGKLAALLIGNPKEEETQAQFKAIFGGAGLGLSFTTMTWAIHRFFVKRAEISGLKGLAISGIIFYMCSWVMTRWHDFLIDGNYRQLKRLRAAWTIFVATLRGPPAGFDSGPYERLPPPPQNPFIPRQIHKSAETPEVSPVPTFYLMQKLLAARKDAIESLRENV